MKLITEAGNRRQLPMVQMIHGEAANRFEAASQDSLEDRGHCPSALIQATLMARVKVNKITFDMVSQLSVF